MKNIVFVLAIVMICVPAFASTALQYSTEVLKSGWAISDAMYDNVDEGIINDLTIKYQNNVETLANYIVKENKVAEFKEIYGEQDIYGKALLNPVIDILKENPAKEYGADTTPFPGYGYPEPGYNYRRGLEARREFLSAFWRNEERYLETNQENELTIEIKFLADFTNGVQKDGGGEIKSMEKVNINVNGELKECVKIRYTIKKSLRVTCTVKFQKTKVWFELFKQKKAPWYAPWQNNPWEKCGETYNVVEEATGEAVATNGLRLAE